MPRRVTVPFAVGFVAGSAVAQQLPALPPYWSWAVLLPALGALIRFRPAPSGGNSRLNPFALPAAFALGFIWAVLYAAMHLSADLPLSVQRQSALVEGIVLSVPQAFEHGKRFDFAIREILEPGDAPLPSRIRLNWYDRDSPLKAGEHWQFRVSLRHPHGTLNPGGLDYERWLFAAGIRAVGYVRDSRENRRLADGREHPWSPRVWRQALYDRLSETLAGSPMAGIIVALTLGSDQDIGPEQWEVLRRTGTAHLVAISGSHIGLIAGFVFFAVRAACARLGPLRWPPPRIAAGAAFTAALLYSALADFAIPTQRALIMIAIAMGAVILRRNSNPLHILATAALAVVLHDPLAAVAPGFWLSFAAVALILFGLGWRREAVRGWRALLLINWGTAVGLAPFLLLFFQQVSLVSPVANLLAVPVLGVVLIPLCLAGALLLPIQAAPGGWLLALAERLLLWFWPVLEWLSALPLAQWTHAEPPFWTIPPALAGTLLLLAPKGIPARWLGLVLLLPAATADPARPDRGGFRLVLLDVGQGLAAVAETRNHTLVFDTGARFGTRFDMGGAVIEPYLRHQGVKRIDALIVSHGDNDHIGGARSLIKRFPIDRSYSSVPAALPELPVLACRAGLSWEWDGVRLDMLAPIEHSERGNDNSCVLKITGSGGSALLTGDIERRGEALLVRDYRERLASDILVVPHHGSRTSSTRAFLEAVKPRYALIPDGYLNRFGFPHPEVLRRYRDIGAAVFDTAGSGAISVEAGNRPGGLRLRRYRVEHGRYWNAPADGGWTAGRQ
jgi:competence protein ComEC